MEKTDKNPCLHSHLLDKRMEAGPIFIPSLQMRELRPREGKVHKQKVGEPGFEPSPLAQ